MLKLQTKKFKRRDQRTLVKDLKSYSLSKSSNLFFYREPKVPSFSAIILLLLQCLKQSHKLARTILCFN